MSHIQTTLDKFLVHPHGKWKDVSKTKNIQYDNVKPDKGKFAQVFSGNRSSTKIQGSQEPIALKSQEIKNPKDLSDISYREVLIFEELSRLKSANSCDGFVTVYDWFKSDGDDHDDGKQYMNIVLEKADETLRQHLTRNKNIMPLRTYKSVLFQILYALYHAQKKFEFVHNDLHMKNIMLKKLLPQTKQIVYTIGGQFFMSVEEFIVKITDFGLSRIKLSSGDVVYNPKMSQFFDPSVDIVQIVDDFRKIRILWPNDASDEDRAHYKNLKLVMRKQYNVDMHGLVTHPFFSSMLVTSPPTKGTLIFGEDPEHPTEVRSRKLFLSKLLPLVGTTIEIKEDVVHQTREKTTRKTARKGISLFEDIEDDSVDGIKLEVISKIVQ